VREYARIQQFPDDWIFEGSIAEKYRQIGNAVPVGLGHQIGRSVLKYLVNYEELSS
jgi:DNA (cytosine-5)-methyltransferase 1